MFMAWSPPVPIHLTPQLKYPRSSNRQLCCCLPYLTPSVFWLKVPKPSIGGKVTKNEYVQMKKRVDLRVERGNCLSLVTIMYLCRANTDRVTIDWIPGIYQQLIRKSLKYLLLSKSSQMH